MNSITRGLLAVATFVLLAVAGSPALAHGLPGEPLSATSPKPAPPRKAIDLTISTSGDILIH